MICHVAQFMTCPKCSKVFCVPVVVSTATVWHAPCDAVLMLGSVVEPRLEVTRAVVVFNQGHNRLEVAIAADCE